jgi:hypothetical protein
VLNASLEFVYPRLPAIGFLIRTVILLHPTVIVGCRLRE